MQEKAKQAVATATDDATKAQAQVDPAGKAAGEAWKAAFPDQTLDLSKTSDALKAAESERTRLEREQAAAEAAADRAAHQAGTEPAVRQGQHRNRGT
jgi:hypothetical protein